MKIRRYQMQIDEVTKEEECCCSCKHNKRIRKNLYMESYCNVYGHYIGYVECFNCVCERWEKNADSD